MTVKQILIGTLLGAAVIGLAIQRLPKHSAGLKAASKDPTKSSPRFGQIPRKHAADERTVSIRGSFKQISSLS